MSQNDYVNVTGNLAQDPEPKTIKGRQKISNDYNPVADGPVAKPYMTKDREILRFTVMVNGQDAEGNDLEPTFINVTDWDQRGAGLRQGDFVKVTGILTIEEKEWNGETRTFRDLILKRDPLVLRRKADA